MYTRILVWASTPVPVASEPRRDQDRDLRSKGCAVKNWTTFEGVYFNNGMEQTKKN